MDHQMQLQKQKKRNTMRCMVAVKRIPNSSRNLPWNNLLFCVEGKKVPQKPYHTQIEEAISEIKTSLSKRIIFIAFGVHYIN